nr:hypothetical protein CFP56_77284 [Quercus suber]
MSGLFYKPVKMYVVRYLDEILVITLGSKTLTMDFKNWVLKYLEGRLDLRVDKMKTAIHSAVSENIRFLGMELQAVPPSVLHPPMTEKAIRARKKYLRPIKLLIALEDTDIIKWYAGVGRRWLDFFCCCHNFKMVKTVVTYHLRFSCILTLAEKHESTKREAIMHYTKDLKVSDFNGNEEGYFPTEREVKIMGDQNLSDPMPVDGALSLALISFLHNWHWFWWLLLI